MSQNKAKKKGHSQAHQNKFAWTHNPNSSLTKKILSLDHYNLCFRCEQQIEWRKQYRKYKPLKEMRRCSICLTHSINRAYHTICDDCAQSRQSCAKCAKPVDLTGKQKPVSDEEMLAAIKNAQIKERFKRTIIRNWERGLFVNDDILKMLDLLQDGEELKWEDWIQQDLDDDHEHGASCGSGGCSHSHNPAGYSSQSGASTSVMGRLAAAEQLKQAEERRKLLDLSDLLPEDLAKKAAAKQAELKAKKATEETVMATTPEKCSENAEIAEEKKEDQPVIEKKLEEVVEKPAPKEKKKIIVKQKQTVSRTSAMMAIAKGGAK